MNVPINLKGNSDKPIILNCRFLLMVGKPDYPIILLTVIYRKNILMEFQFHLKPKNQHIFKIIKFYSIFFLRTWRSSALCQLQTLNSLGLMKNQPGRVEKWSCNEKKQCTDLCTLLMKTCSIHNVLDSVLYSLGNQGHASSMCQ